MDNLTHTLTGLMLSRAGLNRWCPRATPILLLAVNAPDTDIVTALGTALDYLDAHRGITHSLLAAPVMAALAVLIVRIAGRKPLPWLRALITGLAGVLSHLAMDWTNTYGIRLLLPFSSQWLQLHITNVIDLWIWTVFILCLFGPLLSRLVSTEIGAKSGSGRGAAVFALLFLVLYTGFRFTLHQRAVNTLNSHLYGGAVARRVAAFPHFANPFFWIGYVESDRFVVVQRFSLLRAFDPGGGEVFFKSAPSPALDAARRTATFARYLRFAQFPFFQLTPVDKPEGGIRVDVMDLRFGQPQAPRFVATAILDAALRVVDENYSFGPLRPR
jgi:inner membrane protein